MIGDIYNSENAELMSSTEETIHGELQTTINAYKYNMEDEGAHILKCLDSNEYFIHTINARGREKPVSFNAPRELTNFCKSVASGDIQDPTILASFPKQVADKVAPKGIEALDATGHPCVAQTLHRKVEQVRSQVQDSAREVARNFP